MWVSLEAEHQQHGKFPLSSEKNFLITMIALIFVILQHSLQWTGEFYLYLDPVSEYLLFDSAARRFLMVAGVEGKFLSSSLYLMTCSLIVFGSAWYMGLITCVRRANENARNLISVVQFLISRNIFTGSRSQELYVKNI